MIESYNFGKIIINGKAYTSDVIVFSDRIKDGWWRREGHRLHKDDLTDVIAEKPKVIVIGTGYSGLMNVPGDVKSFLEENGIEVIIKPTKEACVIFNNLLKYGERAVAALHLTC